MNPTPTGLYGPGDYPADFVTIEDLRYKMQSDLIIRQAIRDAILDLAHDLDARGLVLCERISPTPGASFLPMPDGEVLIAHPDIPPHIWTGERMVPLENYPLSWKTMPAPITTADADLATGGE